MLLNPPVPCSGIQDEHNWWFLVSAHKFSIQQFKRKKVTIIEDDFELIYSP